MKAISICVAAQSDIARSAADYINSLAMSNGFSVAMNTDELGQYLTWFSTQIQECDEYIASNLVIETDDYALESE